MNDSKVKQQIVDKLKASTNILVTVSKNPSVDALSAALGLTLLLNKIDKHATAVFSGAIPPAITFLDPEKTFENTVDSLRDFIIALDKEKADHLRYKVDGDVVKIFITPYRTTIGSDDLEFSQGDYNVELVIALGVDDQDHLDSALEAHGRILHDATVATITAREQVSNLGSLDWHEDQASGLSEMIVSLSDAIKSDQPLLDESTATAFLTGIVASTDRFSNNLTTSRVMTMAAKLMGAGADQQLIAAKLQESHEIKPEEKPKDDTNLSEDTSVKLDRTEEPVTEKKPADGELDISHIGLEGETLDEIAKEVHEKNQQQAADEASEELAQETKNNQPAQSTQLVTEPETPIEPEEKPTTESTIVKNGETYASEPAVRGAVSWTPGMEEPSFGGTLNATTEQAADDAHRELLDDQNKMTLTHGSPVQSQEPFVPPAPFSFEEKPAESTTPEITIPEPSFSEPSPSVPFSSTNPTLADLDAQNRSKDHDDARQAVEAALNSSSQLPPVEESTSEPDFIAAPPTIVSPFNLPTPPPLPDFSTLPETPIADAYALDPTQPPSPEILGDILAPDPSAPLPSQPNVTPKNDDPGQFKIPGQ